MNPPPRHPREEARLRKLQECEILDTPPEEVFDRIAHVAGQLCDCPLAAVNLIDRERQWFKAAVGTAVRSTSRDIALCAHTVAGGTAIVVDGSLARSTISRLSAGAWRAQASVLCLRPCFRGCVAGRNTLCLRRRQSHAIPGAAGRVRGSRARGRDPARAAAIAAAEPAAE